jgi:cobalamin biosynthesis Co2+ chelatase CbiK
MCYSGMTIQGALSMVRMNAVNISQKVIIMLGHSDILGVVEYFACLASNMLNYIFQEKYDAVKCKWYMTLLLEELSNLGIDVKLMTLPLLYPYNAVTSKRIEDFNDWIRRLHSNDVLE